MNFEITGFSQKLTALIQKDEGFRYKRMVGSLKEIDPETSSA